MASPAGPGRLYPPHTRYPPGEIFIPPVKTRARNGDFRLPVEHVLCFSLLSRRSLFRFSMSCSPLGQVLWHHPCRSNRNPRTACSSSRRCSYRSRPLPVPPGVVHVGEHGKIPAETLPQAGAGFEINVAPVAEGHVHLARIPGKGPRKGITDALVGIIDGTRHENPEEVVLLSVEGHHVVKGVGEEKLLGDVDPGFFAMTRTPGMTTSRLVMSR